MKSGRSLSKLAQELDRQRLSKAQAVTLLVNHHYSENSRNQAPIKTGNHPRRYDVTPRSPAGSSRTNSASRWHYFRRMRSEQPNAARSQRQRTWLEQEVIGTCCAPIDGRVRAVLSDLYRRLDSFTISPSTCCRSSVIWTAVSSRPSSSGRRCTSRYILPRLQYEMRVGDVVQAGIVISNSKWATAHSRSSSLVFRLVCSQRADRDRPVAAQDAPGPHWAAMTR